MNNMSSRKEKQEKRRFQFDRPVVRVSSERLIQQGKVSGYEPGGRRNKARGERSEPRERKRRKIEPRRGDGNFMLCWFRHPSGVPFVVRSVSRNSLRSLRFPEFAALTPGFIPPPSGLRTAPCAAL